MDRLPDRYQNKISVDPVRGCWEWHGEVNKSGYGRAWYKGFRYSAHRLVYWMIGTRPFRFDDPTHEIEHLCENRCCVNPLHLEPTTRKINAKRVYRRRKRINRHGELVGGVL